MAKSKAEILANISTELSDNNAGLISARDVRHNMEDTINSINGIVSSGDHNVAYPFVNNVRVSSDNGNGMFVTESGITFDNGLPNAGSQYEPYPGAGAILHNTLGGLTTGDPHLQYLPVDGSRGMEANLMMTDYWIGSSGTINRGIKFQYEVDSDAKRVEQVLVSGQLIFEDSSRISTGNATAKAWVNFDASTGSPSINSSHNISSITDLAVGKFQINFTSGVLSDNNYSAIGNSNARDSADDNTDFDRNTVGLVVRQGDDAVTLRNLSYSVLNELGAYVDAKVNDLVVFGLGKGVG